MAKTNEGPPTPKASGAVKPTTNPPGSSGARPRRSSALAGVSGFAANLAKTGPYKPTQGKRMRWATGATLGAIVGVGVYLLAERMRETSGAGARALVPAGVAAVLGWIVYRLMHFPPFAEFLIATEAEMNKVSWIGAQDLKRAAQVVLVTVVTMSVFLFLVDGAWVGFLKLIGILGSGVSLEASPNS